MPEAIIIEVHDIDSVTIDGQHAGSVVDVLHNYAAVDGIRGKVLAALSVHVAAHKQAADESAKAASDHHSAALDDALKAHAETVAALESKHQAALESLAESHGLELKRYEEKKTLAEREIAHRERIITDLGGREEWEQTHAARQRRAAVDLEKAKAEYDRLHPPVAAPDTSTPTA